MKSGDPVATLVMPFGGHCGYGKIAIDSLIRWTENPMALILLVEPIVSDEDRAWAMSVPDIWPGPCTIIENEERRGFYGGSNYGTQLAETERVIIWVNDEVASPGWDVPYLEAFAENRIVTGRLVEPGSILIADPVIWKNFGYGPEDWNEASWLAFCKAYTPEKKYDVPRQFQPIGYHKSDFERWGTFDSGKDTMSLHTYREDLYFFLRCYDAGAELVEVQECLTYHFQEDETFWSGLAREFDELDLPLGVEMVASPYQGVCVSL